MNGDHNLEHKAASQGTGAGEESEGSIVPVKAVKAAGGKGPCSTVHTEQQRTGDWDVPNTTASKIPIGANHIVLFFAQYDCFVRITASGSSAASRGAAIGTGWNADAARTDTWGSGVATGSAHVRWPDGSYRRSGGNAVQAARRCAWDL